jgi:membrane protease YdiL (CAAX protease family)
VGLLAAAMVAVAANPWEEIGWRGFALPRLEARYKPLLGALIVGVLWALWHIPLFVWSGSPMSKMPFWTWGVGVLGRSILLAWLYNRSGRSLAICSLFHVLNNVSGAALGVRSEGMLSVVDLSVALLVVLVEGASLGYRSVDEAAHADVHDDS